MGLKRTPADIAFSMCVRERTNWTCERCGKQYVYPDTQGLDCSHYFSRSNYAVRFDAMNAFVHCRGCHQIFGDNPHDFSEWAKEKLGEHYNGLVSRSNSAMAGKVARKADKSGEIAKFYRAEHEHMTKLRSQGDMGRIEFRNWVMFK